MRPFWRPKPFTSVTAIPPIPSSDNARWTASSLNGLMTASIFFIRNFPTAFTMPMRRIRRPARRFGARPKDNLCSLAGHRFAICLNLDIRARYTLLFSSTLLSCWWLWMGSF